MILFTKRMAVLWGLFCFASAWQPNHKCPESLEVTVPNNEEYLSEGERYHSIWDQFDNVAKGIATMHDVHTVLEFCPNIKSLNVHPEYSGCEGVPDRWNIPWSLDGTDEIPALESITLQNYDFDQVEWDSIVPPKEFVAPTENDTTGSWLAPWKVWFHLGRAEKWFDARNLPKEQREKTNLELWLDQMDWTKLKSLTILEGYDTPQGEAFYERLPNMVPALESLAVEGPWWDEEDIPGHTIEYGTRSTTDVRRARDFILAFPENSLKSLSWRKSGLYNGSDFLDILERFGQGLTSLEWRDVEREDSRRPVFTPAQLREIGTYTPNLESLTIDINRDGNWPLEELSAVAESFPKLKNLTVYLEIASQCYRDQDNSYRGSYCRVKDCWGWDQFQRPLLDEEDATTLFNLLRDKKVGDELTSATFRAGDWESTGLDMWDVDTFLHMRKAFVDCSVLETDGSRKLPGAYICHGEPAELSAREKQMYEYCEPPKYGGREQRFLARDEL